MAASIWDSRCGFGKEWVHIRFRRTIYFCHLRQMKNLIALGRRLIRWRFGYWCRVKNGNALTSAAGEISAAGAECNRVCNRKFVGETEDRQSRSQVPHMHFSGAESAVTTSGDKPRAIGVEFEAPDAVLMAAETQDFFPKSGIPYANLTRYGTITTGLTGACRKQFSIRAVVQTHCAAEECVKRLNLPARRYIPHA